MTVSEIKINPKEIIIILLYIHEKEKTLVKKKSMQTRAFIIETDINGTSEVIYVLASHQKK